MSLKEDVLKLKKEKNAIILAHYYVDGAVQDVADFVGDSYALAKKAKKTSADIIVFAGVKFMGESAKMLNPEKKVLMPDLNADCPMAHMASKAVIKKMKEEHEDLAVVCYINSTAELKTMADVFCVLAIIISALGFLILALPYLLGGAVIVLVYQIVKSLLRRH